ncbi:MAG: Rho termination factor N-terminal domain-containing protein [Acidimicrobiales bacterium]
MGKKKDPIQRAEEVGQQIFEVVSSGLADIVSRLQELTSTIDQKVDEQFRTFTGEPPPKSNATSAKSDKADKADKAKGAKKSGSDAKTKATKAKKKPAKTKAASGSKSTKPAKPTGPTRDELYQQAQDLDISGRSKMSKGQLAAAVKKAKK